MTARFPFVLLVAMCAAAVLAAQQPAAPVQGDETQNFRFRSSVEMVNVSATVTDAGGRFVPDLKREDFRIFEDGVEQSITQFSSERVPVSLGIVLDTSASMEGEKIQSARAALRRFLTELLDPSDEIFLYRFDNRPEQLEGWTRDRTRLQARISGIYPRGGTAMYDAMIEAVPYAETGENRKRAVVLISDGNDTNSEVLPGEVERAIRQSEVLVYAIGIDGTARQYSSAPPQRMPPQRMPPPRRGPMGPGGMPFPFPGGGGGQPRYPQPPSNYPRNPRNIDERVNVTALRDLTDDSGGRTEIVRSGRDLDPAVAGIADELSKQYALGYPSTGKKDGRWHDIRVQVRDGSYTVRARRGYVAEK